MPGFTWEDSLRTALPPVFDRRHIGGRATAYAKQPAQIVEHVDAGALVVGVTESHPLSDLAGVYRRSEAGQTHGKITILP